MNRKEARERLTVFDDTFEIVDALNMLAVSAPGECEYYMREAANHIEGLYTLTDEVIRVGVQAERRVKA